jgi:hypothetical protein
MTTNNAATHLRAILDTFDGFTEAGLDYLFGDAPEVEGTSAGEYFATALEWNRNEAGELVAVLTSGGPHVEVRRTAWDVWVSVWWGSDFADALLFNDAAEYVGDVMDYVAELVPALDESEQECVCPYTLPGLCPLPAH